MRYVFVALVALGCLGCGSRELDFERAAVKGTVTYGGEPLPEGVIRFVPALETKGVMVFAEIQDGKYQLSAEEGPAIGEHRVEITAERKTGEQIQMPDEPPGTMEDVTEQYIPENYNLHSKLTADISPGENTEDFTLEK